jgi:hypothetical protein
VVKIAKFMKALTKELEEFRGLGSMVDVLLRKPSISSTGSPSSPTGKTTIYIVPEELSEAQQQAIPPEKQAQFIKLCGAIQTMIQDFKFVVHSMVSKVKSSVQHTEVVSTAKLLSRLKKSLDDSVSEISDVTTQAPRRNEIEKQRAFQLTLVTQIKDMRNVLSVVRLELQQQLDDPNLIDTPAQQKLTLTVGKIITYIKKV